MQQRSDEEHAVSYVRDEPSTARLPPSMLVPSVYWHVWSEFYEYKPSWSLPKLAQLIQPSHPAPHRPLVWLSVSQAFEPEHLDPMLLDVSGSILLAPHRSYEMCAPTNINISWRHDEVDYTQELAFAPYFDQPDFDTEGYCKEFERLTWINDKLDPDCKDHLYHSPYIQLLLILHR
jgi:hypothetical protein